MDSNSIAREPITILVIAGSRREGSLNRQLAALACRSIEEAGASVVAANIAEFDAPGYDGDAEVAGGIPPGPTALRDRLAAADGFVLVSPEYNASMPGIVKNVIDWTSRFRPQPFNRKPGLVMSASPSMVGGNRGLWALRVPLEHLGARIYPDMFSLAKAGEGFAEDGSLAIGSLQERFDETLSAFLDWVEAARHYPCAKARWFEFLGEEPQDVLDRVQA